MTDFNDAVVSNIKVQMKKRRTKQTELADMLGVAKSMMSRMLKGNRGVRIDELVRQIRIYQIDKSIFTEDDFLLLMEIFAIPYF